MQSFQKDGKTSLAIYKRGGGFIGVRRWTVDDRMMYAAHSLFQSPLPSRGRVNIPFFEQTAREAGLFMGLGMKQTGQIKIVARKIFSNTGCFCARFIYIYGSSPGNKGKLGQACHLSNPGLEGEKSIFVSGLKE